VVVLVVFVVVLIFGRLFIALATRLHECIDRCVSPALCEQFVMSTVPSRVGGGLCVLMSSEAHVVIVAIWLQVTGLLHRSALSG